MKQVVSITYVTIHKALQQDVKVPRRVLQNSLWDSHFLVFRLIRILSSRIIRL
jgi:hypothetical protein